jgi:hypothetical protein
MFDEVLDCVGSDVSGAAGDEQFHSAQPLR